MRNWLSKLSAVVCSAARLVCGMLRGEDNPSLLRRPKAGVIQRECSTNKLIAWNRAT